MQQLGPQQPFQFIETAGPLAIPHLPLAHLAPMAVAKQFLVGPAVPGQGMADRHQQGQQLNRPAIFAGGASE